MAATGFLQFMRVEPSSRPVAERIHDYCHVYTGHPADELTTQSARCMDCGVPFCHDACPLGNLIPEWNDLASRGAWREALERLHATNNFPEFTGLLCPAPCEGSCVLGLNREPVTIKSIELAIVDRGFDEGWIVAEAPATRTWKNVAIVGSGPAGLAAGAQLNRAGHSVTIFEKAGRIGGLLRYGIPEFKLEKRVLDRRLDLLAEEGVQFRTGVDVGADLTVGDLRRSYDAVLLAGGAGQPRDLPVPGRTLDGVHVAMEYLTAQNRRCEGDRGPALDAVTAEGKHVVIIGGGDTGADCLGTAHRQGATSVVQLELMPQPPDDRGSDNPWPQWPLILRTSAAHDEGGDRLFAVETTALSGDDSGHVRRLHGRRVTRVERDGRIVFAPVPDSEFELPADLVLLAMGFTGPVRSPLLESLGVRLTERGTVWRDAQWMTSVPGVFATGDMHRGQSLIVWAIADGRQAAAAIDRHLRREVSPDPTGVAEPTAHLA